MTLRARAVAVVAAIEAMGAEAERLFTAFDPETVVSQAAKLDESSTQDQQRPLHGVFVTIKDLFDQEGQITTAASRLLAHQAPATQTAESVNRLIEAGAIIVGRTTMSEFAYSGVGLNPHYGTPGSIFDPTRIPGGSTSGGALSVAHQLADLALGSDTGGSIRIPAAVNGLYGFKPSQTAISDAGVRPLAPSYDTVGPIASTLDLCERAFACLRTSEAAPAEPSSATGTINKTATSADNKAASSTGQISLRLALPSGAFTNDIDTAIHTQFHRTLERIKAETHQIETVDLSNLSALAFANRIIVSVEAHTIYEPYLSELEILGDPRVLARIRYRESLSESEVQSAYAARAEAIQIYSDALQPFDALLAPTLAIETPTIGETEANFDHINMMMLRNPSLINLTDGCAISIPVAQTSEVQTPVPPAALMIAAVNGSDDRLLSVARQLDDVLIR